MSPAWVLSAWRYYAGEARPWVLAARSGTDLVGLVPLALRRGRRIRTLVVSAEALSDYWDVLALPSGRAAVIDAVARELRGRAGEWDELSLGRLLEGSETRAALERTGVLTQSGEGIPCPRVELPGTFDDYLERCRGNAGGISAARFAGSTRAKS